jgi:hypothetical protein
MSFGFRLGPGLMALIVAGESSIPDFVSDAVTRALSFDGGTFSDENIYSPTLTIGPKLPAGIAAVQGEIARTALLPEFEALSA